MAKSSPAFQFYPGDFTRGVLLLSNEEIGIYVLLLCFQWENGRVPLDEKQAGKIANTKPSKLVKVLQKFSKDSDGYFNERLEIERVKQQEYRSKQSQLANRRWDAKAQANPDAKACNLAMPAGRSIEIVDSSSPDFCSRGGIGDAMRSNGFPEAWSDWRAYRSEKGEPLTSYTAAGTMQKCNRWGAKKSVEIIRNSIEKSWKNLLDPSEINQGFGKDSKPKETEKPKVPTETEKSVALAKSSFKRWKSLQIEEQLAIIKFVNTLSISSIKLHFSDEDQNFILENGLWKE